MTRELLAVAEAHRVMPCFEGPFSGLLTKNGGYDADLTQMILREFLVARTISWAKKRSGEKDGDWEKRSSAARDRALPKFAEFLNELPPFPTSSLYNAFSSLITMAETDERTRDIWQRRKFYSALSKLYMARKNWKFPPFDNYAAGKLALPKGGKRSLKYYEKLDKVGFLRAVDTLAKNMPPGVNIEPARILDKYLVLDIPSAERLAAAYLQTRHDAEKASWLQIAETMQGLNLRKWADTQ